MKTGFPYEGTVPIEGQFYEDPESGLYVKREPVISSGWAEPRKTLSGSPVAHPGVDWTFRRLPSEPVGLPYTTKNYGTMDPVRVIAAGPGTIWKVDSGERGIFIIIDHGKVNATRRGGWVTFYQHLQEVDDRLVKGFPVEAGDFLGIAGDDPTNPDIVHLHFGLFNSTPKNAVDPAPFAKHWTVQYADVEL